MFNSKLILLTLGFVLLIGSAHSDPLPLALVYKGDGSCEDGCSEAAAAVATLGGFRVKYVGPSELSDESTPQQVKAVFEDAKVWIQPGGVAVTAILAMSYRLKTELISFVKNGGGYVGFCAGAYISTAKVGKTRYSGLGIFPGRMAPYGTTMERWDVEFSLEPLTWNGQAHTVFYQGGPYLYGFDYEGSGAEQIATYDTGYAVTARAPYGLGRVFVSGVHPEAEAWWTETYNIHDPDGMDWSLAIDMIKWASRIP